MSSNKSTPAGGMPAAPTPEMIEAVFATLNELGWQQQSADPKKRPRHPPPRLPTGERRPAPTKAMMHAVFALTRELGWTNLNPDELTLIHYLRRTTYKGRNIVGSVVHAIQQQYPWVDGDPYNITE